MPTIDDIDWPSLRDDVGPATEIGEALRALNSPDEDIATDAWDLVCERVLGGKPSEITIAVVPILCGLGDSGELPTWELLVEVAAAAFKSLDAPNADPGQAAMAQRIIDALDHAALHDQLARSAPDLAAVLLAGVLGRTDEQLFAALRRLAEHEDLERRAAALVALTLARRFDPDTVTLCRRLAIHASEDDGVAAALLLAVASVRDRLSEAEVAAVDQLATPRRVAQLSKRLGDLIELPKPTLARPSGPLETARVVFAGASIVLVEHPGRGRLTLRMPNTGLQAGDQVAVGSFVAVGNAWLARVAEFVDGQGQRRRHEFDDEGLPPGRRDGLLV